MNNLKIHKWNNQILNGALKLSKDDSASGMVTYDLKNGLILKVIVETAFEKDELRDFKFNLERKILHSKKLVGTDIVLPHTMYMDHDEVVGYTVPKILLPNIGDTLEKNKTFSNVSNVLLLLASRVKKLNEHGIIFPDLCTYGNVFYNAEANSFKFIDYDGIQIFDTWSDSVSALIKYDFNPMYAAEKYTIPGDFLWTSNIDRASIVALYLKKLLGVNILEDPTFALYQDVQMSEEGLISFDKDEFLQRKINTTLDTYGILDDETRKSVVKIFDLTVDNDPPDEVIKHIMNSCEVVKNGKRLLKLKK